MWILNFLPYWVFYLILLAGVVGLLAATVLKVIPFISAYRLPLQVVSLAFFAFGLYMAGAISNQEAWDEKIKEMENKVALAEEKSKAANGKIEYKFVDRVKVVSDVQVVVQEKIKEVATIIDSQCKLTPEAIDLLNAAAKNIKPGDKEEKKQVEDKK